ncbi:MAG: cation-translocating P-type ATPase [Gammaproteobacteria bacterium]|nr:cation-translocating P-type ATPase [Gammaproteobacteria bacterium]
MPRQGLKREVDGKKHSFCCYGCCLAFQIRHGETEEAESTWLLLRLGVGGFLAMNIMLFSLLLYSDTFGADDSTMAYAIHILLWLLTTPLLIILGLPFLQNTWSALKQGRLISDSLVSLGVLSAYTYSSLSVIRHDPGIYFDTVTMILLLFTLGRYIEALGRVRAMRSLAPLLAAKQIKATVITGSTELRQAAYTVPQDAVVRVRPGERIPVDGSVIEGISQCNEAVLTGESKYLTKSVGSTVCAGSINGDGQLLIRATAAGMNTRWGRICEHVRDALKQQGNLTRIIDRVATIFVPAVLLIAIIVVWQWSLRDSFEHALMYGLAVLVVACPCALGLAAPLATSLGIAQVLRRGGLIRGGAVLENLAKIRLLIFDKTGTVTAGKPRLFRSETIHVSENDLLQRVMGLEQGSEHPLARGIVAEARQRQLTPVDTRRIQAIPGKGLIGQQYGETIAAGNAALMQQLKWTIPPALAVNLPTGQSDDASTQVYVGWNDRVVGLLWLMDKPRDEATAVVKQIHQLGLATYLLSGDGPDACATVTNMVGITNWQAELSPDKKVTVINQLTHKYGPIAMVGDGINDAPVLATASVGIALASATDLARESADIVLSDDGLVILPELIQLARRVRRTIFANIIWAFAYNTLALSLAAFGNLSPVMAAALMAGSSLLVILHSLRLEATTWHHKTNQVEPVTRYSF